MSEVKFTTDRLKMWRTIEHEESFERTLSNIEQYGWDVMVINGDPQTRFSYTVGVNDTLGFPELIVVGLTNDTGFTALNVAVTAMQKGIDLTKGRHRDVVGEVEVEFRPVARDWIEHVMYRDHWYHEGKEIPALQMIYPDLEGKFQWEEGFQEYFRQPLMQTAPPTERRAKDFWGALRSFEQPVRLEISRPTSHAGVPVPDCARSRRANHLCFARHERRSMAVFGRQYG